jgi:hypothetical protein
MNERLADAVFMAGQTFARHQLAKAILDGLRVFGPTPACLDHLRELLDRHELTSFAEATAHASRKRAPP